MSQITIASTYDLLAVATAAGQSDSEKIRYRGGVLIVDGVSQADLDAAVAAADAFASLRNIKNNEIKQAMSAAITAGHSCSLANNMSITMDADMSDMLSLDGALRLATNTGAADVVVRDASNVQHTLALASLQSVVDQLGTHYQSLLNRKWVLNDAIRTAPDAATLNAVAW